VRGGSLTRGTARDGRHEAQKIHRCHKNVMKKAQKMRGMGRAFSKHFQTVRCF
jgi:hypothetical protein